jgi:hypothetical protein
MSGVAAKALIEARRNKPIPSNIIAAIGSSTIGRNNGTGGIRSSQGWLTWLSTISRQAVRMPVTHNLGVGGDTMEMMAARIPLLATLNPRPALVIYNGGANNIINVANTLDSMAAIHRESVRRISEDYGFRVAVVVPHPGRGYSAAIQQRWAWLRQWIHDTYNPINGVDVWDACDLLVDPAGTTYETRSIYMVDQLHLEASAAHVSATRFNQRITALGFSPRVDITGNDGELYNVTNNPRGNLLASGRFTGTGGTSGGGTPSGSIPTGWMLAEFLGGATVAGSYQTDADGTDWYRLTLGGTQAAGSARSAILYADVPSGLLPDLVGKGVSAGIEVRQAAGAVGILQVQVGIRTVIGGVTTDLADMAQSGANRGTNLAYAGVMETDPLPVSSLPTTVRIRVTVTLEPSTVTTSISGIVDLRLPWIKAA